MPGSSDPTQDDFVPPPARGRTFRSSRAVRLGDAAVDGRLRLDALARFLQDVAADDSADAGFEEGASWVVRRADVRVGRMPRFGERVHLTTYCGGTGSRWALRRTSLEGEGGGRAEAAVVWVYVDARNGRPAPLPASFQRLFGEACGERKVSGRLRHPPPPAAGAEPRPWPLRVSDFDVLGHVNNAAYWAAVEDELARLGLRFEAGRAELEYRVPIGPATAVQVVSAPMEGGLASWLLDGATVCASAVVAVSRPS